MCATSIRHSQHSLVRVYHSQIDLNPGSGVRAIKMEGNQTLRGNGSRHLQPAATIQFLATR